MDSKRERKPQVDNGIIFAEIASILENDRGADNNLNFCVIVDDEKRHYCTVTNGKIVRMSCFEEAYSKVSSWFRENYRGLMSTREDLYAGFGKDRLVRDGIHRWFAGTDKIIHGFPKAVCFKDQDDYCFYRLPFNDPDPDYEIPAPTPHIDRFLKRCTNQEAIKAWVWSLFEEGFDKSQYLWFTGPGGDGKSSFAQAILSLFGKAATSVSASQIYNKFWPYNLIGKRICAIHEAPQKFASDDRLKVLTGDRLIGVEPKGKDLFMAEINTRFILLSNDEPIVSHSNADLRRLIHVQVEPMDSELTMNDLEVQKLYASEMENFLGNCKVSYWRLVEQPKRVNIWVDRKTGIDLADAQSEEDIQFLEAYFDFNPKFAIASTQFNQHCKQHGQDPDKLKFLLKAKWGCKMNHPKKVHGQVIKSISGIGWNANNKNLKFSTMID